MRKAGKAFSGGMLDIDAEVESALQAYNWPGNVRQLENVIHRAYILADGGRITMSDLPPEISRMSLSNEASGGTIVASESGLRERLRLIELEIIVQAINDSGGDRKAAAQKLGIGLSSLYRKMDELGTIESSRVAEPNRNTQ